MLAREGHALNHKKLYRLYREERLMVRRRRRRKRALGIRAPMALPIRINQRWSLDFVSDTLSDGRRFRILCIVDDFSRECLAAVVDTSLGGVRVVRELERLTIERALPETTGSTWRATGGTLRCARRPSPPLTCALAAAQSQLWRAANRSPDSKQIQKQKGTSETTTLDFVPSWAGQLQRGARRA